LCIRSVSREREHEFDLADRSLGLRPHAGAASIELLADLEMTHGEVNVCPRQSQKFAESKTGEKRGGKE
jgi:hypothetical protein